MKIKRLVTFLLWLLFPVFAKAQEPFMRQLTTKDGLPQQQVLCHFKDSRGFLWLGTRGGLSRFDGKSFKNYSEEDGILHNTIHDIAEDEKGNIWFATVIGIGYFDGQKFKTYRNDTIGHVSMTIINSNKIYLHSKDFILWQNDSFISRKKYFKNIDVSKIRRTYYDKPTGNMYLGMVLMKLCIYIKMEKLVKSVQIIFISQIFKESQRVNYFLEDLLKRQS